MATKNTKSGVKTGSKDRKDLSADSPSAMPAHRKNIWKAISIAFIILFVIIVIVGALKAYHFRNANVSPTASEQQTARSAVLADLASRGIDPAGYTWRVADFVRPIMTGTAGSGQQDANVIEVSLTNETIRHLFIVNVQSGDILMYSLTEFHDGLNHTNEPEREMGLRGFPFPQFPFQHPAPSAPTPTRAAK